MVSRLDSIRGLAAVVFLAVTGGSVLAQGCPGQWVTPTPHPYTTFAGAPHTLYAWPGDHIAILTPTPNRCGATMRRLVAAYDDAYEFYFAATGIEPIAYAPTLFDGRGTIAIVPDGSTCGAGCGYLGFTGIELIESVFEEAYVGLHDHGWYTGTALYELGRNFWFYGDRLGYPSEPGLWGDVDAAYAVFMSLSVVDALGLTGSPFGGSNFADWSRQRFGVVDRYVADPALNWGNAVRMQAQPPLQNLGSNPDIIASFLHRLEAVHGQEWVRRFWREAGLRPMRATAEDAVDNMILAASIAADANLTDVIETSWRWPLSTNAGAEALALLGAPVAFHPYDGTCGNGTVDVEEECDDGNATSGDGCEADCTLSVPGRCVVAKRKAMAKRIDADLRCAASAASRGGSVSPNCLAKAGAKMASAWTKAETKGGCPSTNTLPASVQRAERCAANLAPALDVARATLPRSSCATIKLQASGRRLQDIVGCHGRALARGLSVDAGCISKAETRFSATMGKGEVRGDCFTIGDTAAIARLIDACSRAVLR